jgi:hypothetical protein
LEYYLHFRNNATFNICKHKFTSKDLAIMDPELARVQALFSLVPGINQALQDTMDTFNKTHNPSSIPWKEDKRPNA